VALPLLSGLSSATDGLFPAVSIEKSGQDMSIRFHSS